MPVLDISLQGDEHIGLAEYPTAVQAAVPCWVVLQQEVALLKYKFNLSQDAAGSMQDPSKLQDMSIDEAAAAHLTALRNTGRFVLYPIIKVIACRFGTLP